MRRAVPSDAPAIIALIRADYARSAYAGRARIAEPHLESTVGAIIANQNQTGPHSTCVFVIERKGKVVAFMAGVVDRAFFFLAKMQAQDVFLIGTPADKSRLVDAYVAWARSIPSVLEIAVAWTGALPGGDELAALCKRKGFTKTGEHWQLDTDAAAMMEAA
jgi:hypothetical protein